MSDSFAQSATSPEPAIDTFASRVSSLPAFTSPEPEIPATILSALPATVTSPLPLIDTSRLVAASAPMRTSPEPEIPTLSALARSAVVLMSPEPEMRSDSMFFAVT